MNTTAPLDALAAIETEMRERRVNGRSPSATLVAWADRLTVIREALRGGGQPPALHDDLRARPTPASEAVAWTTPTSLEMVSERDGVGIMHCRRTDYINIPLYTRQPPSPMPVDALQKLADRLRLLDESTLAATRSAAFMHTDRGAEVVTLWPKDWEIVRDYIRQRGLIAHELTALVGTAPCRLCKDTGTVRAFEDDVYIGTEACPLGCREKLAGAGTRAQEGRDG